MTFRNWTARKYILSFVAVSLTAIFISLGFWQLRRLDERREANAVLAARRVAPEVELDSLPKDTALAHFRRVHVRGAYDHPQEIILTLRGRNGSPGVNILTPLLRTRKDTVVLVNRGWVTHPMGSPSIRNPGVRRYSEREWINRNFSHERSIRAPIPPAPGRSAFEPCRRPESLSYPIADYLSC